MFVTIGGICLGLFFIMFYFLTKKHEWKPDGYGKGIIDRYVSDDRNNKKFYITFNDNGKEVKGITCYYKNNGSYNFGDTVNISWIYNRLGDAILRIEDESLSEVGKGSEWFSYVFLVLGILIIILALAKTII